MLISAGNVRAQVGVEVAFGTEVAATVVLSSVKVTGGPEIEAEEFKASGAKMASAIVYGAETGNLNFDGKASYEEMPYFVKSIKAAAAQDADVQSLSVEIGVPGVSGRTFPGTIVTGYTLKGNTKSVDVSGTMKAQSHNANALAPGLAAANPTLALNRHVTVTIGGVQFSANPATKAVNRVLKEWEFAVTDIMDLEDLIGSQDYLAFAEPESIRGVLSIAVQCDDTNLGLISDRAIKEAVINLQNGVAAGSKKCTITSNVQFLRADSYQAFGRMYGFKAYFLVMNDDVGATGNLIDVVHTTL